MDPDVIGWIVFLGLLLPLLGVLVWSLLRIFGRKQQRNSAGSDPATDAIELQRHHALVWAGNPSELQRDPLAWPLAASAGFALCRNSAVDQFAFTVTATGEASTLYQQWRISNHSTLLSEVGNLLIEGHRGQFAAERTEWLEMSAADAAALRRDLARGSAEDREMATRMHRVLTDERGVQTVDFTAWDLVRAMMLLRAGVKAGYLSDTLAHDTALLAAERLAPAYTSWQALGDAYVRGRWHWRGSTGQGEAAELHHDTHREETLLRDNGPRSVVPYVTPFPASRRLIVQELRDIGFLTPEPAGEWEQQLRDQVLGAGEASSNHPPSDTGDTA